MARGIGIRYGKHGMRALALERTAGTVTVTGMAAGPANGDVNVFLREHGLENPEAKVAVGLCPGDFLSAYLYREEGMSDRDVEELLRWELGRKILTPWYEHTISFAMVSGVGFIFSGRKELSRRFRSPFGKSYVVDVEPIAMVNGCEGAGEIDDRSTVLVCAEAEGVSTALMENRSLVAFESFAAPQDGLSGFLPGLEFEDAALQNGKAVMEFARNISESLSRLVMRGKSHGKKFPERLILSGAGTFLSGLSDEIEDRMGMETSVSDPFRSLRVEAGEDISRFTGLGAAFTVCYGLALRAMEE